jgi:hypothetical protein
VALDGMPVERRMGMKKVVSALFIIVFVICISFEAVAENWQVYDGEGAAMLEDVPVTSLSRIYVRLATAGKLKVSFLNHTTGEDKLLIFEGTDINSSAAILFDQGQYDFFIETTSDWVAVVEPIKQIEALTNISASVSYVSNMFPIDKPIIVKINAKTKRSCLFSLDLYTKDGDDWKLSDSVTEFMIGDFETQEIFRTEQATMGIFVVHFPGEEWSMTVK